MEIKKVCVIGAGRMGRQIGLCAAIYGYKAIVFDVKEEALQDVKKWEEEYLAGRIAKGRMTEEQVAETKANFFVESDLQKACEDVDLVIEAIFEDVEVKRNLFHQIRDIAKPETIIATNSSFMVSSIFKDDVKDPAKLCNMHFYNPALVLKFVEIVQGEHTSEDTAKSAYDFCVSIGKKPVWQKKEIAGFAGNYIIAGISQAAKDYVSGGMGRYQEADIVEEQGFGRKMGTFRLTDLTGVGLAYTMMKATYEKTGTKPQLYDLYEQMVKEDRQGQVTGHGFYDYKEPFTIKVNRDREGAETLPAGNVFVMGAEKAEKIVADITAGGKNAKFIGEDFEAAKGADIVIAAFKGELNEVKAKVQKLATVVSENAIIALDNFDFVSSAVKDVVPNPSRLASMHFCPLFDNTLVEIVQGEHTSEVVAGTLYDFAIAIKKIPAWEEKETPEQGYHLKALLAAIGKRAEFLVDGGYCTKEDVDIAMEHGIGFKKGYYKLLQEEL